MVVGGYAVNLHGHNRNTKDLDIWIATDPVNAELVAAALQEFRFAPSVARGPRCRAQGKVFAFGREPYRVDLLTSPDALDFEECYKRRREFILDAVRVPTVSFEDLLEQASGRPQDLADVHKLRKKPNRSTRAAPNARKRRKK